MLSHLFNPFSATNFWKNQIFAVKKLSQTLNCRNIVVIELRITVEQMSSNSTFLPNSKGCIYTTCYMLIAVIFIRLNE